MEIEKQIAEIREDIGELKGITKMVLDKLNSMEKKYNGHMEKIVELEKQINETSNSLNDHLNWHKENEKISRSWKIQYRSGIVSAIVASVVTFILSKFV